ncbi:MAG: Glutamate--tRNA ligase 1 [Candidatus Moanabacter tarae]|uniref:Glutamate--tRNA ligase 1 n=1 Tax=Candidatus Moanibacter tarae TaxID=2200854 RepID=A0A2Z4AAX0_9BACT|nr:MAG: Glutamate--tRNA ligase 1 [Candidatus Moanabacter tarae]
MASTNIKRPLEAILEDHYRGRIAPTPTGFLHLGHAHTFLIAQSRAKQQQGILILRNEDLDQDRCKPQFADAMLEDLAWVGLVWQEGPKKGGIHGPYTQSQRLSFYHTTWEQLKNTGLIYPSPQSRKDIARSLLAPHSTAGENIFPASLRPNENTGLKFQQPGNQNWRFRVPDGQTIEFFDFRHGKVAFVAGKDFGDFVVWRKDGFPSYELAVVADDHAMKITEVVRGEDLLLSTARQLLIYRALGWRPPQFYHCQLIRDRYGKRLAKRDQALSLRYFRQNGLNRKDLHKIFQRMGYPLSC